ncbi:MAG TPA: hypothetical protein VL132_06085 [Planctomycetaceae bacterium]|nr:hypothetical protein [Planctomycetaceae bacterium]
MDEFCRKSSRRLAAANLILGLVYGPAGCRGAAPKVQSDAFKCGEYHGRGTAGGVHGPNSIVYKAGGSATTLDGRPVDSRGLVIGAGHESESPQQ